MAIFPSLPETTHLSDLFRRFPDNSATLMQFVDGVLRSEGELSIGERELIGAYVSGLNACRFCQRSHMIYAGLFGIDEGIIEGLLKDIETSAVRQPLKPILHYVKKLNTLPVQITNQDAQAGYRAGWNEAALFEAIEVCAVFNLMNRIVEGSGVNFDYDLNPGEHSIAKGGLQHSYLDFGRRLGVIAPEDDSLNM